MQERSQLYSDKISSGSDTSGRLADLQSSVGPLAQALPSPPKLPQACLSVSYQPA